MSNEDDAYNRLMNSLDAEASDAGWGYGAETSDRPGKRRPKDTSRPKNTKRKKDKSKDISESALAFWGILILFSLAGGALALAIEYWYITLPIIAVTLALLNAAR
ncbi:hypothetical protein KBY31_21620 [Ruegeria pomeroyi]|nr:hypothetical protein [Ruegeria pomeroyi]